MKITEKQMKAVEFVFNNPGARPDEIVAAAGASVYGSNGPEFIWRLIANGALQLDVTPEARDALGLE